MVRRERSDRTIARNPETTEEAPMIEIPIFYGEDLESWLSWIEDFVSTHGFSDFETQQFAYGFIEGDAYAWYCDELSRSVFRSWEDLKRRLLQRFGKSVEGVKKMDSKFDELLALLRGGSVSRDESENSKPNLPHQEKEHDEKLSNDASPFEISSIQEKESQEAIDSHVILEKKSLEQTQVPISSLESGHRDRKIADCGMNLVGVNKAIVIEKVEEVLFEDLTSMGCEELFGCSNTEQTRPHKEERSEMEVNDCAYQVFDQMSLGGKQVTKKRKRKRRKANVKLKSTPRGKRPRLGKHVRTYGDHIGSLRETKMGNTREVIKCILGFAKLLKGHKRVTSSVATKLCSYQQFEQMPLEHKSMQRKMPKSWTFKYKTKLLQRNMRAMKQKKHSVKSWLLHKKQKFTRQIRRNTRVWQLGWFELVQFRILGHRESWRRTKPGYMQIASAIVWTLARGVFVFLAHRMLQRMTALIWGKTVVLQQTYEVSFPRNVDLETMSQALQDFLLQYMKQIAVLIGKAITSLAGTSLVLQLRPYGALDGNKADEVEASLTLIKATVLSRPCLYMS